MGVLKPRFDLYSEACRWYDDFLKSSESSAKWYRDNIKIRQMNKGVKKVKVKKARKKRVNPKWLDDNIRLTKMKKEYRKDWAKKLMKERNILKVSNLTPL